jgi:release factor glutamine methyltransferase
VTVLEVIQRSTDFLARKGVDSPRLNAELLLAHILNLPRMRLYLEFERSLQPAEIEVLREFVRRRGQREPLQQILGSTSFCGLEIKVNRHVLVPRPETELLAELGWKFLQSRSGEPRALDWGTGTGCLAIALAVHCPAAGIIAADVSVQALELAAENARIHHVSERLDLLRAQTLQDLPSGFGCDLLLSNPPYIPTAEIQHLPPEVRDYEPHLALDGGADGLAWPRRFAADAARFLRLDGRLMLEFGDGQAEDMQRIFQEQNWIVEALREDYTRRPRILVARRKQEKQP